MNVLHGFLPSLGGQMAFDPARVRFGMYLCLMDWKLLRLRFDCGQDVPIKIIWALQAEL